MGSSVSVDTGPALLCRAPTHVAVVGAGAEVTLDEMEVLPGRVFPVESGQRLAIATTGYGLRAYVAVRGGFCVPPVLGSRSTDRLTGLGPRPIGVGDELATCPPTGTMADHLVPEAAAPAPDGRRRLRVTVAGDDEAREWQAGLFAGPFEVDEASDRVGLRLRRREGRLAVRAAARSAGTTFGTVQVPPDGNPVILMADHATLGGYPVAGVVITADLGELGRCRPGDSVELVAVTVEEAAAARRSLARALERAVVGPYPVAAG